MRTDITLPVEALRVIDTRLSNVFTSVYLDIEGNRLVIKAQTLGKVQVTMKFHPALENGKVVLQDAEIHGVLGIANMSESLIFAKITRTLDESSKKIDIHALSVEPDKMYLSFSLRTSEKD